MIVVRMHGFASAAVSDLKFNNLEVLDFESVDGSSQVSMFIPNGSAVIEDGKLIIDLKKATGREDI